MKVFLGGTCNESTWREKIIPMLTVDYFNPVVDDWTSEHQARETEERKTCDICLYVITPKMTGCCSIAEAVDDSNKRPEKTVFVVLLEDEGEIFTDGQVLSLGMVAGVVGSNGAQVCRTLEGAAAYINGLEAAAEKPLEDMHGTI